MYYLDYSQAELLSSPGRLPERYLRNVMVAHLQ
jgi:hypothetical protein